MRSSWSVIPDIAETTTMGKVSPGSVLCRAIICATRRMRSPLPTEVPPNLRTLTLLSMRLLLLRLLWRRKRTSTIVTYFLYIYICRFACREGRCPQCLVQVIDQILYRLQAYRQANEVGRDTGLELLVGRQL